MTHFFLSRLASIETAAWHGDASRDREAKVLTVLLSLLLASSRETVLYIARQMTK